MSSTHLDLDKGQEQSGKTHPSFYTLITVFFFWGFIGASNGVFIPFCKDYFGLSQAQSQLIDFAFYVAYFLGAVGLYAINNILNLEFLNKIGLRMGIVLGLLVSALGSISMIVSVNANSYLAILASLFIIGLGFSLQQTCANPFAIALGNPTQGAQRLSLAGGINSLGTTVGPIILGIFLSHKDNKVFAELSEHEKFALFESMNILYVVVTLLFLAAAAMFYFSNQIPDFKGDTTFEKAPKANIAIFSIAIGAFVLYATMFAREFTPEYIKDQKASHFLHEYYSDAAIRNKTFEADEANFNPNFMKKLNGTDESFKKFAKESVEGKDYVKEYCTGLSFADYSKDEFKSKVLSKAIVDNVVSVYKPDYVGLLINVGVFALLLVILLWALTSAKSNPEGWGSFKYPQVSLGMLAIFTYVGVEVTVQSNLGELLKKGVLGDFNDTEITALISLYWGSLMVGRWTSGSTIFNFPAHLKNLMIGVVSFAAFAMVIGANMVIFSLTGKGSQIDVMLFIKYTPVIIGFILIYILGKDRPATTLLFLSVFGAIAVLIGLFASGMVSVYAFVAGGMACSIMWPFIFSLATTGLGKFTSQASAFLVMMILGGGVISLIQGKLADIIDIKSSYLVAVLCFVYLAYFAISVKGILKKQGIDADAVEASGGH
jgi:MFS transporter, FHS family, L-fucose permease